MLTHLVESYLYDNPAFIQAEEEDEHVKTIKILYNFNLMKNN